MEHTQKSLQERRKALSGKSERSVVAQRDERLLYRAHREKIPVQKEKLTL